jgi:pseudaminic acid biosynthesis-associated methylase
MSVNPQLDAWRGDFGKEYTERNCVDWHIRLPAFREIVNGLSLSRVLEVGCNRGHNLVALREIIGPDAELIGIEPNAQARQAAAAWADRISVLQGTIYDLPFKDGFFDLTFTCGVLIHIDLPNLANALRELYRCSRRYVLAIEYYAEQETVIPYRGHNDLLWKRDFLHHYRDLFPDLVQVRGGYLEAKEGFDRSHWWLLEKRPTV